MKKNITCFFYSFSTFRKDKKRADYIFTDKEMISHLINVAKNETNKTIELANNIKNKIISGVDTNIDWNKIKEQEKEQDFYHRELINLFFKRNNY